MRKRDKIEFIILGALALASLLFIIFRGSSKIHYRLPAQPEIAAEEITRITASGESGSLELIKDGDAWIIVSLDRAIDNEKMDRLLNLIAESAPVDLISERSSGAEYGFTRENVLVLTVTQGDKIVRNWTLGNLSESGGYTYFRIGGSGAVYTTRGDLRSILTAEPVSLRDRKILSFDRDSVAYIQYSGDGKTVKVTKQEGIDNPVWTDGSGREYDDSQMTNLLYRYFALKCDSYASVPEAGGETARVEFGGMDNVLMIYGKEGNRYLCGSSQSPDLFYLNEYMINSLLKIFNPQEAM